MNEETSNNKEFQFKYLTENYAEQAITLLAESFVYHNNLWKALGVPIEDAMPIMNERVTYSIERPWSMMIHNEKDNKLLMVQISYDLVDYLQCPYKSPIEREWLSTLKEAAAELEDEYFRSLDAKRGEYIYGDSAASDANLATKKLTQVFWAQALLHLQRANFKAVFLRSTNPKTTKLITNMGGEVVKTVYFKKPGMEQEFIALVRIDFDKMNIGSTPSSPQKNKNDS